MNQPSPIVFGVSSAPSTTLTELKSNVVRDNVLATTPSYNPPAVIITDAQIDAIGGDLGSKTSQTTTKILQNVAATDTDAFGVQLNELISTAKGLDPKKMKGGWVTKVFGAVSGAKEKMLAQYQNVDQRMTSLVVEMDKQARLMTSRTEDLEAMFEDNYQTFLALEKEQQRGGELLVQLEASIAQRVGKVTEAFDIQRLVDDQARAARLEKRIDDLGRSMHLARLAAPEIRMMQGHARSLVSNFRDMKDTTIPAWKGVFSRYIIGQETAKSAQLQTSIADATNEAFRTQADQQRANSSSIAQIQQRSVVDTDTLEYMQDQLLGSIADVLRIQAEGKAARVAAMPKLQKLETELIAQFSTPKQITA